MTRFRPRHLHRRDAELPAKAEAKARRAQEAATAQSRADRLRRLLILGVVTDRLIRESTEDHNRFLRHLDRFLCNPDDRALFDLPKLKPPRLSQQQGDSR